MLFYVVLQIYHDLRTTFYWIIDFLSPQEKNKFETCEMHLREYKPRNKVFCIYL